MTWKTTLKFQDTNYHQYQPFDLHHLESRWRNSHVLVYHGPLLSHLLGVVPSTFTMVYRHLFKICWILHHKTTTRTTKKNYNATWSRIQIQIRPISGKSRGYFWRCKKNGPSNLMWFSLAASENGMYVYISRCIYIYMYVHVYVYIYIYFMIHELNSKNFDLLNSSKNEIGVIFTHAKNSQKSSSNKKIYGWGWYFILPPGRNCAARPPPI